MSSLTNTAQFARKVIVGLGILLGASLIFFVALNIGKTVYKTVFPESPPPALIAFGKLPPINFEEGTKPADGMIYKVETVTGELKDFSGEIKVFVIDSPTIRFGDVQRTNSLAESLGFKVPPVSNDEETAVYVSGQDKTKTFEIGITSGIAIINSDYFNNQSLIASQIRGENLARDISSGTVGAFGLRGVDYPAEKIGFVKYKIDNGKLTEVTTLPSANLIQVNYNREDLDKIPVVYTSYQKSKVRVLVSNSGVVAAKVNVTRIQPFRFSTYPLKGTAKAYEQLKAGKAIYNKENTDNVFEIRDIGLAYLDTEAFQPYLQPVYVFKGDDGLEAYVPAIVEDFIDKVEN